MSAPETISPRAALNDAGLPRTLSVVIPAYNAAGVLAQTLESTRAWLTAWGVGHEIIVVDDGSRDTTAAIAGKAGGVVQVRRLPENRGKGFAVRTGMLSATMDWVLFMDADNSTPIAMLERFAAAIARRPEAEVLIASRRLPESRIVRAQHPIRQALGRTFPRVVRLIALPELHDTQCGFKLFSRRAAREIFSRARIDRFAFDVEVLLLARALGMSITEVAVDWDNPTDSTVRLSTDTVGMLRDVIKSVWRLRRGLKPV